MNVKKPVLRGLTPEKPKLRPVARESREPASARESDSQTDIVFELSVSAEASSRHSFITRPIFSILRDMLPSFESFLTTALRTLLKTDHAPVTAMTAQPALLQSSDGINSPIIDDRQSDKLRTAEQTRLITTDGRGGIFTPLPPQETAKRKESKLTASARKNSRISR